MKSIILMLGLFLTINCYGQDDPCNPDVEDPTYELPMYLTDGIVYACLDSVPLLWGPPYPDVADLVFNTLEDNCLSVEVPPWYGPTLASSILDQTDTSITYTFTAYDDAPNYNSQSMTFYFNQECDINTGIDVHLMDEVNNSEYELYNLNGQRVYEPLERGMYIKKYANSIQKIIVR